MQAQDYFVKQAGTEQSMHSKLQLSKNIMVHKSEGYQETVCLWKKAKHAYSMAELPRGDPRLFKTGSNRSITPKLTGDPSARPAAGISETSFY